MRIFSTLCLLVGITFPSLAGDYDAVINAAKQAWPERRTVVIVCNKDASSMALMDLGSATEGVLSLLVLHVTAVKELDKSLTAVTRKPRNEVFLLLVSDDPVTGDSTEGGRILISRMIGRGIPVVATTPGPLKLGAIFALGPGTGDKLLTNPEMAKKMGLPLPEAPAPAPPPASPAPAK